MKIKQLRCSAVVFILLFASLNCIAAASRYFTYDSKSLSQIKEAVKKDSKIYNAAYKALISKADIALTHKSYSVTDKTLLPASGNKHDYYSFGPYWWPNPETKNHLPYIRRDGEINPEAKTDATDSVRLASFAKDMQALGLAYYYTDNKKYAEKATEMATAWFVNSKTRMNPTMEYAQAIPGIVDGRGIGIIDSRHFITVMDSIELIRPANTLSKKDYLSVKSWYKDFNKWLLTSNHGFEESNWHNNHGTWYDAQVTAFSLFTDQPELAKKQLKIAELRHLASQIDNKGYMSAELERTRPWHYTNFALEAFVRLGRYGEITNVDLWNFQLDNRNLKKALIVVANQVNNPIPWPYDEKKLDEDAAVGNVLAASRAYEDLLFKKKAEYLQKKYSKNINLLIIAPR
jgi:hypothetical protein